MPRHLLIRILPGERPRDTALVGIATPLPCVDLGHECGAVWHAPIKTLAIEDADFDFRHVEPTGAFRGVVKGDATHKRPRLLDAEQQQAIDIFLLFVLTFTCTRHAMVIVPSASAERKGKQGRMRNLLYQLNKGLLVAAILGGLLVVAPASAQVTGLSYQEIHKDGQIYVFNTYERYTSFQATGKMGKGAITLPGRGPKSETLVGENATAIDMFLFKNNLPGYDRPTAKPAAASDLPKTTVGGRMFADLSSKDNKDDGTGVKSSDSGIGTDAKRFYLIANTTFNSVWSAKFETDIGDAGAKRYDVFVKNAYLQAKLDDAAIFRIGAADAPWTSFVDMLYGQRYIENAFTDSLSFANTADWGMHFLGSAAGN